jgi:hypothetical protein
MIKTKHWIEILIDRFGECATITWHNDTTIKYIGRCPICNREIDYGCRPIGGTYQCIHCNCFYKLSGD